MRSTASLGGLLLSACAGSPNMPAPAEPPPSLRTWLGQVARADLSQAAGMAVPLYAHAQTASAGVHEAARIEAEAPALPILPDIPAAAAWPPRAPALLTTRLALPSPRFKLRNCAAAANAAARSASAAA